MDGAYVYLLKCSDGSYYCGSSRKPIDERISEHENGHYPAAYTFTRRPITLVWCEHFTDITNAVATERRIKGWSRAKKQALIADDWDRVSELAVAYQRRKL